MKKKVLLVIRWPVGGIRTFVRYVYRHFDPEQWRFTILAPDLEEMGVLVEDLSGLDVSYAPVYGIPNDGSSGFLKMFRSAARELAISRYDLVHSHGFIAGLCVALPAFVKRTPHLMTVHETLDEKQFAGSKGKVKRLSMAALFHLIDKIHSVSNDAQDNLFSYFPGLARESGKCVVIPNGVEIERFDAAEPRDLRSELGLNSKVFLIGFLGRFIAPKGFRYLVDAIEILSQDARLRREPLVLTFGDGGFIQEEKNAIKERGLEKYFRFMPFTPNVANTIKGLDAVAMPSLREACGLLAMEALVCGTPLIGTDCIGLREVLANSPARIVPPGDSKALAQAILAEIQSPSKSSCVAFQNEAVERFDIRKKAVEIEKIFHQIIRH